MTVRPLLPAERVEAQLRVSERRATALGLVLIFVIAVLAMLVGR